RVVDSRGGSALQHRDAVEHRQHPVEDDEVEAAVGGAEQAVLAVRRLLDAMALLRQAFRKIGCGLGVVLDEKDLAAHGVSGCGSYVQSRTCINGWTARCVGEGVVGTPHRAEAFQS